MPAGLMPMASPPSTSDTPLLPSACARGLPVGIFMKTAPSVPTFVSAAGAGRAAASSRAAAAE